MEKYGNGREVMVLGSIFITSSYKFVLEINCVRRQSRGNVTYDHEKFLGNVFDLWTRLLEVITGTIPFNSFGFSTGMLSSVNAIFCFSITSFIELGSQML